MDKVLQILFFLSPCIDTVRVLEVLSMRKVTEKMFTLVLGNHQKIG